MAMVMVADVGEAKGVYAVQCRVDLYGSGLCPQSLRPGDDASF